MGRLTESDVRLVVSLIKSGAVTAAQFDASAGLRASAMLGCVEAVLSHVVAVAGGPAARSAVEEALRYVPTHAEVEARKAASATRSPA